MVIAALIFHSLLMLFIENVLGLYCHPQVYLMLQVFSLYGKHQLKLIEGLKLKCIIIRFPLLRMITVVQLSYVSI